VLWYPHGDRARAERTLVYEKSLEEKLRTVSGGFTH